MFMDRVSWWSFYSPFHNTTQNKQVIAFVLNCMSNKASAVSINLSWPGKWQGGSLISHYD